MKTTILFLLLFICQPLYAQTWAQLAIGGGFECVLIVTNKSGETWNGELALYQGNAQAWQGSWRLNGSSMSGNTASVSIAPKGTHKFVFSASGGVAAGYLELDGDIGSSSLDVSKQFFYLLRQNGQLIDSIGSPESEWDREFVFSVEKNATTNTGFAWAPSSSFFPDSFSVVMTLFDSGGNQVEQKVVQYEGHSARFFDEIFSVEAEFLGHVFIEATDFLHVTVLRMDLTPLGPQFTSVPPDTYIP